MFKNLLLLSVLCASTGTASADRNPDVWDADLSMDNYVMYPVAGQELLDFEYDQLGRSDHADPIVFELYTSLPEPQETENRIWPMIKAFAVRNHMQSRIFRPSLNYHYTAGFRNGCREFIPNNQEAGQFNEQVAVPSQFCDDQCVFDGHYCAPQEPDDLPEGLKGKDIMNEIIRRACLDEHITAADPRYFDYLRIFDNENCFYETSSGDKLEQCSRYAFDMAGISYNSIDECIHGAMAQELLEKNVEGIFLSVGDDHESLPRVFMSGMEMPGPHDPLTLFDDWCNAWPTDNNKMMQKPISCQFCQDCDTGVKNCLWGLQCDGRPFDLVDFAAQYGIDVSTTDGGEDNFEASGVEWNSNGGSISSGSENNGNDSQPQETDVPTETDAPTDAPEKNEVQAPAAPQPSNGGGGGNGSMMIGLILGLIVAGVPAAYFMYRDFKTREMMAELQDAAANGFDPETDMYEHPKAKLDSEDDAMPTGDASRGDDSTSSSPSNRLGPGFSFTPRRNASSRVDDESDAV